MIKVATVLGEALFDDVDWDIAYSKWGECKGYLERTYKTKKQRAHILVGQRHGLKGKLIMKIEIKLIINILT